MHLLQKDYLWELMYMSEGITSYTYPQIYHCVEKIRWKFIPSAIVHKGSFIDRVRIHKHSHDRYCSHQDISYIHDPRIYQYIDFGRANVKRQPIFYGAITTEEINLPRAVAYMETSAATRLEANNPNFRETFTLSRWEVMADIEVVEVIFSQDALNSSSTARRSFENQLPKIQNHPYREYFLTQAGFFSDEYAKSANNTPHDYFITSAYANYIWQTTPLKGITYPSVKSKYEGQNIALLPGVVDKHLKLDTVAVFESFCCYPGTLAIDVKEIVYDFGKNNMSFKYAPMRNNIILPHRNLY